MWFLQIPGIDVNKLADVDSTAQARVMSDLEALKGKSFGEIVQIVTHDLISFGWTVVKAAIVFYIGRWIIRKLKKVLTRIMERREVDSSLRTLLLNIVGITLNILLLIIVVHMLGLPATAFIAVFASAGLAIGLALSGTLQNFAGGVMVLLMKPYHVGDYIEAQGQGGTVKAIQLFNTVINTPDNKTILIPNGAISTGIINNYSMEGIRRVEWTFGIAYGDDFDKAKSIIAGILAKDTRILADHDITIEIGQLASSSVNIVVRAWAASADFWDLYFAINRQVYIALPAGGISFPFNQMDVHLKKE